MQKQATDIYSLITQCGTKTQSARQEAPLAQQQNTTASQEAMHSDAQLPWRLRSQHGMPARTAGVATNYRTTCAYTAPSDRQ